MDDSELFIIRDPDVRLARERKRISATIKRALPHACVMEVGSTAVSGLVGKEDLDFAVRVERNEFPAARMTLDRAFERNPGQLSNAEYQGYIVESPLDAAIQLIVLGSVYDTFESFLVALRDSPDLRNSYNRLKWTWNGKPMQEYRSAKARFVESVIASAKDKAGRLR